MDNNFEEVKRQVMSLCFIMDGDKILLGLKKRGFGQGRWNGFGGKVHEGETVLDAAVREVQEECGLLAEDLVKVGELDFETRDNRGQVIEMHIFKSNKFTGEPTETEEMAPRWFSQSKLPFNEMWPDDRYWFPLFLAGKNFTGRFLFGENDAVLEHKLIEVDLLNKNEDDLM